MPEPVTCPSCKHRFVPHHVHDPDTVDWKYRHGEEPWNTERSWSGLWRRVGDVIAIVSPRYKGFTKKTDGWWYRVVPADPATRVMPPGDWSGHHAATRVQAQKACLALARTIKGGVLPSRPPELCRCPSAEATSR